jgi:hypothetical protein
MDRVNALDNVAFSARDIAPVSGARAYFTSGNPLTATPATTFPGYWANMVQDELVAVIAAAGITPDDTNWGQLLQAIQTLGRIKVSGLTLYVSNTGSDTANTGLSVGSPLLTIQKALSVASNAYDLAGGALYIDLANGTYAGAVIAGWSVRGPVFITGNLSSPGSVVISAPASSCFTVVQMGYLTIAGMTLTAPGGVYVDYDVNGMCLVADNASTIVLGADLVFGVAGYCHISADRSSCVTVAGAGGGYTITGGTGVHWVGGTGGNITTADSTIVLTGTPNFSIAFASITEGATINCWGSTFTGGATGVRFGVYANAVIETQGAGINYLPGSIAGVQATGGLLI